MKKTFSIEWHQDRLKDQKEYLDSERRLTEAAVARVMRLEVDTEFYESQIKAAINSGKTSFDPHRFMAKRK